MNINFSPTSPLSSDGSDLPLALEMRTVSHSYGDRQALDNVSLHLSSGEMMAIVGPNGAGKTTFFNLATGFFYPQNGAVRIFGYDMARSATRALAMLGAVFQQIDAYRLATISLSSSVNTVSTPPCCVYSVNRR